MATPLEPGATAPVLTFTDITGRRGHSDDYAGWFIVYSIADRNSAGALMQWRERAHRTLAARYRDLAIAHISIADLTAVPGVLRGVVRPVLRTINRQATQRMTETLQAAATADARQTYVLVPDWTGDHLAAFGLAKAAEAHCWIVSGGRIAAHLRGGSRDVEPQFVATFDRLCAAPRPATDLVPPWSRPMSHLTPPPPIGLGNLDAAQRRAAYRQLRLMTGISETEPMLPLAPDELRAWSRRYAEVMYGLCAAHAQTRLLANPELLERLYAEYGQPANDAFMDGELRLGARAVAAGFAPIYTVALNAWSAVHHAQIAREVLAPASVAVVERHYPRAMFLRHGLHQEAALGCTAIPPAAPA